MIKSVSVWTTTLVFCMSLMSPYSDIFSSPHNTQTSNAQTSCLAPFIGSPVKAVDLDVAEIPEFLSGEDFSANRDDRIQKAMNAYANKFAKLATLPADEAIKGFEELAASFTKDSISETLKAEFRAAYEDIDKADIDAEERAGADYFIANMDSYFSERLAVPMAMAVQQLSEAQYKALMQAVLRLNDKIDLLMGTSYEMKLLLSVVCNPTEWIMPVGIAHSKNGTKGPELDAEDVAAAMSMIDRNFREYALSRVGIKGYATDYVHVEDLEPVREKDAYYYDDYVKEYGSKEMYLETMKEVDLVISMLLGGAGTRWRKTLAENPDKLKAFVDDLRATTGLGEEFIHAFKAALIQGDEMILRKLMKGASAVGCHKIVVMVAYHTQNEAREMLKKTAESLKADFDRVDVVQDVTSRRDPITGLMPLLFDDSDSKHLQIAVPQFMPENHAAYWDCVYDAVDPMLDMFVLDPESPLGVRDVHLRISNQDNVAAAIGFRKDSQGREHGPGVVVSNLLLSLMKESGVYEWIAELNKMPLDEWGHYMQTEEFRKKLLSYPAMVVEFAESKSKGGGPVKDKKTGQTMILEEPNRKGTMDMLFLNTNTQTMSGIMDLLADGIRPVDVVALREARDAGQPLPSNIMSHWAMGKAIVDGNKPNRMRTKDLTAHWKGKEIKIKIMGKESDIHFKGGRWLQMVVFIVRSVDQFTAKTKEWDMQYLKGEITFEDLLREEEDFACALGFIPLKNGEDVAPGERASVAVKRTEEGGKRPANIIFKPIEEILAEELAARQPYVSLEVIAQKLKNAGYNIDPTSPEVIDLVRERLESLHKGNKKDMFHFCTLVEFADSIVNGVGELEDRVMMPRSTVISNALRIKVLQEAIKSGLSKDYIMRKLYDAADASKLETFSVEYGSRGADFSVHSLTLKGRIEIFYDENAITNEYYLPGTNGAVCEDVTIKIDSIGAKFFYNFGKDSKRLFEIGSPEYAAVLKRLYKDYGIDPDALRVPGFWGSAFDKNSLSVDLSSSFLPGAKEKDLAFFSSPEDFWKVFAYMSDEKVAGVIADLGKGNGAHLLDVDPQLIVDGLRSFYASRVDVVNYSETARIIAKFEAEVLSAIADKAVRRKVATAVRGLKRRLTNLNENADMLFAARNLQEVANINDRLDVAVAKMIDKMVVNATDDALFDTLVGNLKILLRGYKARKLNAMASVVEEGINRLNFDRDIALAA